MKEWLWKLAAAIFPFSCHVCGSATSFGTVLCDGCATRLRQDFAPPRQVHDVTCSCPIFTLSDYATSTGKAIKSIKYRPSKKLFDAVSPFLSGPCSDPRGLDNPEVVIPIPMFPDREKKRGFNQAALIARRIGEIWKVPFCPALTRTRPTLPQAEKTAEERRRNLVGAFALASGLKVPALAGKTLCLIDDVATTGSTLDECAAVLMQVAPKRIIALVLAHSPKML